MSRRRLDIEWFVIKNISMAIRPNPFAPDRWYHCYSRGVDKRKTFLDRKDYERFMHALYLCNSYIPLHRSDLKNADAETIFQIRRGEPLVSIGAFCLMPNHFHILIQETVEGGISKFMQKVGTAYLMYFNIKYERIGSLFVKPFRSKHITDDYYFKYIVQYIHLNAVELYEPAWKNGVVKNLKKLEKQLIAYRYSSFPDYHGIIRPEKAILDSENRNFIGIDLPSIQDTLADAQLYYKETI